MTNSLCIGHFKSLPLGVHPDFTRSAWNSFNASFFGFLYRFVTFALSPHFGQKWMHVVSVTFRITSLEGDQGFPGQLDVQLRYTLLAHHELVLEYSAVSDKDTPVSLTNHAYWAMGGVGKNTVLEQQLQLDADFILALDKQLVPTGELVPATGAFDFKTGKRIGQDIGQLENGYDHYFVLSKDRDQNTAAALIRDPASGRFLQLFTDQPGLQFYSGNFLDGSIVGNQGTPIEKYAALCLEPHGYPNAVNKPSFPTALLKAGQLYRQCSRFVLGYS